jgi:hypothetical protein
MFSIYIMSYSSCSNSALIHPEGYISGAIGSIYEPAVNTVAVASGALLQPMAAFTVPKGRWLVAGVLTLDATTGAQTLAGNTGIAKDAVVFWRSQNVTVEDSISISLSAVFESDGSNVITIPCTYTSSGGSTYGALAAPLSKIQFIRLA